MRMCARALAVAAALSLTLGVAACGGGDDDASDDTTTTTTAAPDESTTTAEPTPESQAIEAYRAAYDAYFAALNPPNPQSTDLMRLFSGEALSKMIDTIFQARNQGVYVVGSFEMHPEVVSSDPTEVVLADCVVETNTTYDAATGAQKDSGQYVHNRKATVVNIQGVWSVASFEQLEEPCTPEGG